MFKKIQLLLSVFSLLSFIPAGYVHAEESEGVYTVIVKKQQEKAKTRWSLAEWLKTKEKMRWMDQWLALNSPSPYEFFIDGAGLWGTSSSDGKTGAGFRGKAAAYASIVGLQLERLTGPTTPAWTALFNFRFFGYHVQGTNMTLQGGLKSRSNTTSSLRNAVFGGALTFYFNRFFGIDGVFRHDFPTPANSKGEKFYGNYFELGPFIDFKFFRIYGAYTRSFDTRTGTGGVFKDINTGFAVGGRFFF